MIYLITTEATIHENPVDGGDKAVDDKRGEENQSEEESHTDVNADDLPWDEVLIFVEGVSKQEAN